MRKPFLDAVNERILLCDGAMGTMLQRAGLAAGACGEAWNIDKPEAVKAIQREYADAGADCIITNTFGGTSFRLALHGEQQLLQLIRITLHSQHHRHHIDGLAHREGQDAAVRHGHAALGC